MKLEYYQIEKLKKEIRDISARYLDLAEYKIFFFGSRVKGNNFERADIDIGIEGPEKIPASIKLKMKEDLEKLPTLYKFDLVDFKNVSQKFKKQALKSIEKIL